MTNFGIVMSCKATKRMKMKKKAKKTPPKLNIELFPCWNSTFKIRVYPTNIDFDPAAAITQWQLGIWIFAHSRVRMPILNSKLGLANVTGEKKMKRRIKRKSRGIGIKIITVIVQLYGNRKDFRSDYENDTKHRRENGMQIS